MPRSKMPQRTAVACSVEDVLLESGEWTNLKASQAAQRASLAGRASGRRRLVDPATCDRDYSTAELEFLHAIQEYKARSGRMFPTWSEVLEVLHGLGYQKAVAEAPLPSSPLH